ncbi:hypothetical protein MARLIPOL_06694 [Marinobacter lipolyticus SM19]|uniref:Helix-turn-helix domain-containing protein n=1 Tax=Marinobacter lipolyticus SM19 TaxID=1318628 RepID=R8B1F4_9GAMM|nr:helix-turn-helix domain-containing protein [Marinobacter lipolyticus]EON92418.1 hypothetical protein MARLIPOL_06694 [Marinobacter lipolyticus SM19]
MNSTRVFFRGVVPLLVGLFFIPFSHAEVPVPDVLTLQEAAELLRTDTQTVELMVKARTIPGRRVSIGGESDSWRFSREALMAWLEMRAASSAPIDENKGQQTGSIGAEPVGQTATETFLREQGVLLAKNNFAFDIGLFYTRRDSQVIIGPAPAALATVETRTATLQGLARYSLSDDAEIYARAAGLNQESKVYLFGSEVGDTSRSKRGDVDIGLRYVALDEFIGRPQVVLGLEGQVRTNKTSPAFGGSVTFLKSLDPAVLFGAVSYKYTDSRDFDDITLLEPEHTTALSFGYAFALNDRLSLNTWVETSYQSETEFTNATLRENDFSTLQLGLTAQVARGVYLQPTVAVGLSGIGSAFSMGLNIPLTFGADGL